MTSKESSNPIVSHTCYMARRAPTDTQAVNLEHVTANSTFRLDLRRMFDTLCAQLTYEVWQGRSSLTSLQRGLHGILHLQSIHPMSSRLRSWWENFQFKSIFTITTFSSMLLVHSPAKLRCSPTSSPATTSRPPTSPPTLTSPTSLPKRRHPKKTFWTPPSHRQKMNFINFIYYYSIFFN